MANVVKDKSNKDLETKIVLTKTANPLENHKLATSESLPTISLDTSESVKEASEILIKLSLFSSANLASSS